MGNELYLRCDELPLRCSECNKIVGTSRLKEPFDLKAFSSDHVTIGAIFDTEMQLDLHDPECKFMKTLLNNSLDGLSIGGA